MVIAVCGLLIRLPFSGLLGEKVPYITFFLATAVSARFGGLGPGLITTVVGAFLAADYIVPPVGSVIFIDPIDYVGLGIFLFVSGYISYVCEALIRSREGLAAAQRAAAEQRELFQQTLLCIGDGVVSTTVEKRIRLMNPVAEELTGWSHGEAMNQPVDLVLPLANEETGELAENPINKALTGIVSGLANHTELVRRDGTRIPIADSGAPIRDKTGSVVGAVIVFRDVSEERRKEQALAEAQQRSRTVLESISDGFAALDSEWRFTYLNAAAEQMVGSSRNELLGRNHWELYPATRGTPVEEAYHRTMQERVPTDVEFYYEPWARWFSARAFPSADGGIVVYFIDVTERKQAQEMTERLAAIVQSSDDAIMGKTVDGTITSWNRGAETIFGYSAAEAIGQPVYLVIPEEKHAEEEDVLARLRRGERIDHYETERVTKDRRRINVSLTVSPIRNSEGQILGAATVARDITEARLAREALRKSNEALMRANRELEEFAYVSSHDLQEPLRMVNIYTQKLVRTFGSGNEDAEAYGRFIERAVKRMDELIRDLLSYSRVIHEDAQPLAEADLSESLASAISVLQNRIEETGAVITNGHLPRVRGDEAQFAQVFQNLLSNSLKYQKPGVRPEIQVSAEERGTKWIVCVRDNGIGFEPEYAKRIFGLFKRLHKDAYPGTGIGLAICERIVERAGGRIWAESQVGQGSVFRIEIDGVRE